MDNPFSRHRRSESRRRAKDESKKLRNFRVQSRGSGIVVNMRVDLLLARVGRDDESVATLCLAHSQLIADPVCVFRGNLSRIGGLADLIAQHIFALFLFPARHDLVAGLRQNELGG